MQMHVNRIFLVGLYLCLLTLVGRSPVHGEHVNGKVQLQVKIRVQVEEVPVPLGPVEDVQEAQMQQDDQCQDNGGESQDDDVVKTVGRAGFRQRRTKPLLLPRFNDNQPPHMSTTTSSTGARRRGFILFLHISKTGGRTLRHFLTFDPHVKVDHYYLSLTNRHFEQYQQEIDEMLLAHRQNNSNNIWHNKTIVLEVHARDNPSFMELVPTIQRWRELCQNNNNNNNNNNNSKIPFFAFTVLREPISFALSFFHYFHVQGRDISRWPLLEPSHHNLMQTLIRNPQCLFLSRGLKSLAFNRSDDYDYFTTRRTINSQDERHSLHKNNNINDVPDRDNDETPVTDEECWTVYQALWGTMDWIGTTDTLDTETIPILRYMLEGTTSTNSTIFEAKNQPRPPPPRMGVSVSQTKIHPHDLSPLEMEQIRQFSQLDLELYRNVQEQFRPVDIIWDNLTPTTLVVTDQQ